MKLPILSKHAYNTTIAAIAMVTLAVVYVAGVVLIRRSEAHVQALATELVTEGKRQESLRSLGSFLQELSTQEDQLSSFFVTPEQSVTIIERIEALEKVVGAPISIGNVKIQNENKETGEGVVVLSLSSQGSWAKMNHLLTLLDTLPFASRVTNLYLDLVSTGTEKEAPAWSLRATINVPLHK